MAKTYNRLIIEIGKPINSIGIRPVEGDTNSRYLDVSLYDSGVPINLTGHQVRINYLKENGRPFFNQGEITDAAAGRCQFALTNDVISDVQTLKAQISIWGGDSEILSTETFNIYVSENIRCDEAVEGTNEFGALVVLFNEIQNALDLMQAIQNGFGKPGDKAAEYGVDTFWGILEILAGRADVETVLRNSINSTMGTGGFEPLNEFLLSNILPKIGHGVQTFTADGTFTVPKGVNKIWVTACGGGQGGGKYIESSSRVYSGYGGDGGECIIREAYSVEPESILPITIGTGGAISTSNQKGGNGGATIIGNLVTLRGGGTEPILIGSGTGGDGGMYYSSSNYTDASNGNDGSRGSGGAAGSGLKHESGAGGGGSYGNGGNDASTNLKTNATSPGPGGGGGGGCYGYNASKGGNGIVIIEW